MKWYERTILYLTFFIVLFWHSYPTLCDIWDFIFYTGGLRK